MTEFDDPFIVRVRRLDRDHAQLQTRRVPELAAALDEAGVDEALVRHGAVVVPLADVEDVLRLLRREDWDVVR